MRDLQRLQMGAGNKTLSKATALMKSLLTPKANLAKIEFLACVTAFLLMLLTIFGTSRRQLNNQRLRSLLWAAYTLTSYLIVYTLGLMTEASFQNELLPVWAIFLMIFFGSSDSYSVHSLEDCERWKNYVWQYAIEITGVAFLFVMSGITLPMISVLILCLIVPLKAFRRAASLKIESGYGRQMTTKLIADYMSTDHRSEGDLDPSQMRGYKVVTIEKVWKCQGWLLRSGGGDKDSKLKDICLSFSFYKLLRIKFSDYSLPKQAHQKAWKLIKHLYAEENGSGRLFRVVELELSFLFDFFYTKYLTIFQRFGWKIKVIELLLLVIGVPVTIGLCFPWYDSNGPQDEVQLATAGGLSIDFLVTILILLIFTCGELIQCFYMAVSDWAKVSLLCKYVTNWWQENSWMEKLIGQICRTQFTVPWERKLHQYSLLESYDYTPSRLLYNVFTDLFTDPIRDGQKQSAPVKLSSDVKKAVFRSLMLNPEVLQNGEASLKRNEVEHMFSWTLGPKTQTQVIIVWHIVTSCKTLEERIKKLNKIGKTMDDTCKVIIQGARLGQQLLDVENEPNFVWKVLAEFWAELMVYVAPSNNAIAHAQHLAMGGEFVTHLWALVSHASIEREPPDVDVTHLC
ncbi:hypothetical protein BT93_K1660 [Corymbia citriodora subsp. variegata]|nr:hypothetical protein BT93_K1660 [Corymbia citriodora subsp. variegata]